MVQSIGSVEASRSHKVNSIHQGFMLPHAKQRKMATLGFPTKMQNPLTDNVALVLCPITNLVKAAVTTPARSHSVPYHIGKGSLIRISSLRNQPQLHVLTTIAGAMQPPLLSPSLVYILP